MDLMGLKSKVAIVTGGASGIGAAVVNKFIKLGIKVVSADLDEELGLDQKRKLKNKDYAFCQVDVADSEAVEALIKFTIDHFHTIDILVNCAGVSGLSGYLDLTEEEWDWTINTNLKGTHNTCLAVAKIMVEKNIQGRIVNLSSINDRIPVAGLALYATSKAGISGLTRNLALELAPYGINVNALCPGAIDTPMMKEVLELPNLAQALIKQIPKGRFGRPEDVAKVIIFLVSNLGDWVTGAEIPVTGGMHLIGEESFLYYFERAMMHEENLPDIPFTRPWKNYNISKFRIS